MLVITVYPSVDKPGYFQAWEEGRPLCVSRQPFLDGARKLLAMGCSPDEDVVMRHHGRDGDALKAKLGVAAKKAIKEGAHDGPYLVPWTTFSHFGGRPSIEESGGNE